MLFLYNPAYGHVTLTHFFFNQQNQQNQINKTEGEKSTPQHFHRDNSDVPCDVFIIIVGIQNVKG